MKKIYQISLQNNLATRKNTLHPAKKIAETCIRSRTIQYPLYNLENPLLIPSASYNLYRTHCTNRITTPGNSHQNRIQYNEKISNNHNGTSTFIQE